MRAVERWVVLGLFGVTLSFQPARAEDAARVGAGLVAALEAAERDDWLRAGYLAGRTGDPVAGDIVTWLRLRDGQGTWSDYRAFLATRGAWPNRARIRIHAERAMPRGLPTAEVKGFFTEGAPRTGTGALRLAEALREEGRVGAAREVAVTAWLNQPLTRSEEGALLAAYGGALGGHHAARLDAMLWAGHTEAAERMLPRVGAGHAALGRARIALLAGGRGVDALIEAVPANLQSDPGLAHARFVWRVRRDRRDDAVTLLRAQSASAATLGRPEAWSNQRRALARRAMRRGDIAGSYALASQHHLTEGSDYADLEWLSGWLALRRMNDPDRALRHFERFRAAVFTPISLGRAGYWLGRTHEALGNRSRAREAYGLGALYQTSFYGQLSALRGGSPVDAGLADDAAADWRRSDLAADPVVRAGLLFHHAGEPGRTWHFLTHRAESLSRAGDFAALGHLALDIGRPHIAVRIGKAAARQGFVLPSIYYPITDLAAFPGDVEPELAMAIARQETELNPTAISPAGARGLMQLMPGTAQAVAGELGLSYSRDRLISDWRYNAQLGTAYLSGLLDDFNDSYVLAAASYNAGPHRSARWIAAYGDPRRSADVVDWIETIPFRETRNYVQRVLEGIHVYRLRLSGEAQPIQLARMLGMEQR